MTTKEFAGLIQSLIKANMTFDARDGANYDLPTVDDDENIVCVSEDNKNAFILHVIKIKDTKKNDKKK